MIESAKASVSLRDVSFRYERSHRPALKNVTLEIPAGEITALLGPNGSGKSTLLHLLLGILSPSSGSILLGGKSQAALTRRESSRLVGLVPQDESVVFDLVVFEYVLLGRAPHLGLLNMPGPWDHQVARETLAATGMLQLQQRPIPSLSGGERQLATIARALAQQSKILLLDEPTSHLDLRNQRQVLNLMRALRDTGVTVIFTTHDPNAAAIAADFVVLLRDGEPISSGPMEEVLTEANLSATYDVPVDVANIRGKPVIMVK